MKGDNGKGSSFLYKLLEYLWGIGQHKDKINIACAAYLLGRMHSETEGSKEQKKQFSKQVFNWMYSGWQSNIKQLITVVSIFVYQERSVK